MHLSRAFEKAGFETELRSGDEDDPIPALLEVSDIHGNRVDLLGGLRGLDPQAFARAVDVPFSGGKPSGPARDVVTGFVSADNHARGRPVGLAVDDSGGLLVADDLGNTVWRVTEAGK